MSNKPIGFTLIRAISFNSWIVFLILTGTIHNLTRRHEEGLLAIRHAQLLMWKCLKRLLVLRVPSRTVTCAVRNPVLLASREQEDGSEN
jgi:hypothetical protein